jgi:hypothetical protein
MVHSATSVAMREADWHRLYFLPMSCRELSALRVEAQELNKLLAQQRATARAAAHLPRGGQPPGKSDYEPLLKRKLQKLAQQIQKHKTEHRCEE